MYKVELYISDQRVDTFKDEAIKITLSTQNVKDISKVFGDFTQSFTLPASPNNNGVFKHYYNVDIATSFTGGQRVDSFIEINNNVFRVGTFELEGVQIKDNEPYAYKGSFYSKNTSLKDLFGEDTLNDLDLSSQDHTYTDTNIEAGLNGFVSGTGDAVIYPLITPRTNWFYDSTSGDTTEGNLAVNGDTSPSHGCFYYDLKPAIKVKKIVDAIATKYGVTFNSDFFSGVNFPILYMWCHRRAGYMFKDQPIGTSGTRIVFNNTSVDTTGGKWNLSEGQFTQSNNIRPGSQIIKITIGGTSSVAAKIHLNKDGKVVSSIDVGTTVLASFNITQKGAYTFSIASGGDAAGQVVLTNATINVVSTVRSGHRATPVSTTKVTANNTASQTITQTIVMADQMPEQKVSEFFGGLVKLFNLVVVPTGNTTFDIEPLDDWYGEGATIDITKHIDTQEISIDKPKLYKRIEYKYNEAESILEEEFRLQNDRGYGDLKADFTFDGGEFKIEAPFDHQIYERLTDANGATQTDLSIGRSITRELEPSIGKPLLFFAPSVITGLSSGSKYYYVQMDGTSVEKDAFHFVSNTNDATTANVSLTLNFGTEVDSYHLTSFDSGLFSEFWADYITDLYSANRRIWKYKAIFPLGLLLRLKNNDKLTILDKNYIINSIEMNLTTGEANLELLNDV